MLTQAKWRTLAWRKGTKGPVPRQSQPAPHPLCDGLGLSLRAGMAASPPRRLRSTLSRGDLGEVAGGGRREDRRIQFRVGIHLGDVVEEADGDLMGDGVNIAARLEGICAPGAICLSEDAYRQVKGRLDLAVRDLGPTNSRLDIDRQPKGSPAPLHLCEPICRLVGRHAHDTLTGSTRWPERSIFCSE
jgi:class 3 adenylate cyclase